MARPSAKTLTEAEERIMRALWTVGEASVRDVADALSKDGYPVAYNTVLTFFGILHRKKYVRFRREGRAHIYRAVVSQTDAQREAFNEFVARFFGGSKNAFAQYFVEEGADPAELARLKEMLVKERPAEGKK